MRLLIKLRELTCLLLICLSAASAHAADPCCEISDPKAEAEAEFQNVLDLFLPGYTVYGDLSGATLSVTGNKVLTQNLSRIRILGVEKGLLKAGSDKYIKAEATIPGLGLRQVWVHYSGSTPHTQSLLASGGAMPWGDSRLTEAYLKNRSAREPWFKNVRHLLEPDSELKKRIIAGSSPPVDLAEREDYYFVVDHENPVPVLDEKGEPTGNNLEPGTVVIVNLLKRHTFQTDSYRKTPDLISPLVTFRTTSTFQADRELSGHLHITSLRDAIKPLADLRALEKNYDLHVASLRNRFTDEDKTLTIDRALRQFHNTLCAVPGQDKNALLLKWKKFIESKTDERSRQIARNAQHVDIVTRTIMYESQRQSTMLDPENIQERKRREFHPYAESCQGDIIALSIRNRAFAAKGYSKLFGFDYAGDFTGVASLPSQYNLWFPNLVERDNFRVTSCFYSDQPEYIASAKERHRLYSDDQAYYARTAKRIPAVLGIADEAIPASANHGNLDRLFSADPQEPGSLEEKRKSLLSFTHYYHPGGLPKGNAKKSTQAHRAATVKNGIVRLAYNISATSQSREYFLVTNGKLTRFDSQKTPQSFHVRIKRKARNLDIYGDLSPAKTAYDFEIYADGKWRDPGEYFRKPGEGVVIAHLMEQDLEGEVNAANLKKTVLPNGLLPQCFDRLGHIPKTALEQGFEIPLYWFSREVRNQAGNAFNHLTSSSKAIDEFMGGAYYRVSKETGKAGALHTKEGQPLKITCVDPAYRNSDPRATLKFPEFGGYCDPNIMLMRSM